MARSPEQQAQSMIDHLPEKTGRSLDEWIKAIGAHGASKHGEIVKWLKAAHGITHGYANLIAHLHLHGGTAAGSGVEDAAAMIDAQYAGKEALRPIQGTSEQVDVERVSVGEAADRACRDE
jgi:hypothetical protein